MRGRRSSSCATATATRSSTTPIRRSVAYAESAERAVSILDHRPDLGADYLALADEVLARLGRDGDRKALKRLRAELAPAA